MKERHVIGALVEFPQEGAYKATLDKKAFIQHRRFIPRRRSIPHTH